MTFEDFKNELFAEAKDKGFSDYELYYSAGTGFSVRVFKGEIAEYKNSSTEGVGFRGTFEGKPGYAYSEKLASGIIAELLDNAAANAGIIEEKNPEKLYPGDDAYPEVSCFNPALDDVDTAKKIDMALALDKYVTELDPRIIMADYCTISTEESRVALANSYGLNLSGIRNKASAFVIARANENGITKSGYDFWQGRDFADFDYKALGKKVVDIATSYLGAKSVPTGDYAIVFNNKTAISLFGTFSNIFLAEHGQKGFSMLNKEKLGEAIAAPIVTIRDDGVTDLSLESAAFDAEGVATQNKAVIENGMLSTLLYNTKSAAKDGVKSTGNASKAGFGGAIKSSISNFYLVPGEKSFDELIADTGSGLLITELQGLHSGANTVSGDFSFSADGFLIEDGKISRPVEQITVAGNFYDMIKNITAIGNDLRFQQTVGMPSIAVTGLKTAGL